jgi:hypothetical protein
MRDWIVNHPTSSQSFNVVFWLGVVAFVISMILRRVGR